MKKLFKKTNILSRKGTTLVELLLYMGILAILLTVLTSIFVSVLDVQSESNAVSSVEQDGNYILARLNYDIHRAQNINIPTANGEVNSIFQIVIDGVNYTYNIDGNNNLVLTFINNGILEINNLNSYGSSVSNLSVERLGFTGGKENSLRITFTLTSRTKRISGFETKSFETNLSLRRQ